MSQTALGPHGDNLTIAILHDAAGMVIRLPSADTQNVRSEEVDPKSEVSTLKRFVVEAGKPGAVAL